MAIQLHPSEVSVLVRDINVYFDHYQQYENYFVSISILDYADPRAYSKRGGFTHEFTNRSDHELYNMLTAMKQYIRDCQKENTYGNFNKEASITLIDRLINKYFPGMSASLITAPVRSIESVQVACDDANRLISDGQYSIAIDRVHTFFQGYIRNKCSQWQIDIEADTNIKDALLSIIDNHQYFTEINRVTELKNIFKSLSNMCDRFDTFRNHHSLAHPSETLLASNEAKLMINVIRSLYDYLENIGENRSLNQMISEDLI